MGKMIELKAVDGHSFSAYRADPPGKPRGAIVVIQEIFGVNSHMKNVTDGYARDGYVAIAPALFDRVQRNVDLGYSPDDIANDVGDTVILGISPDKPAKQAKFDTKHGLGFPLLADEDHAVAEAFDVWVEKSMYGKKYMGILRSAFLIDEGGKVAEAWYNVKPADTATNLLAALGTS